MGHSIQENIKKINSHLSLFDVYSIGATACFVVLGAFFSVFQANDRTKEVLYLSGSVAQEESNEKASLPFASKNGSTYTFSWCQGASAILEKNKMYFSSEDEAQASGRRLSKLCQK